MKRVSVPKTVVIALCITLLPCLVAFAEDVESHTYGDFRYMVLEDGTAEITDYIGDASNLEVPEMLDGHAVTSIGEEAFDSCVDLVEITLPDSLESMESNPFAYAGIQKIHLNPDHPYLALIDGVLFSKPDKRLICYPSGRLDSTYAVPEGILVIGTYAFCGCQSLAEITLPNSLASIGDRAFSSCSNLTEITLPDSLITIGASAFEYCGNLRSVIVGQDSYAREYCITKGLPYIAAFAEKADAYTCGDFVYVVLEDGTAEITRYAADASNLSVPEVLDGHTVTSIGDSAFSNCVSLESITMPNSLTSIRDRAFSYCVSLESITLPDNLTSIGNCIFDSCWSLTEIMLPDNLKSIGSNPFVNCGIQMICLSPDHPYLTLIDGVLCSKSDKRLICYPPSRIGSVYTVPEDIVAIGAYAFYGCKNLSEIILPDNLTAIGGQAFIGCMSLTEITLPDNLKSIGSNPFVITGIQTIHLSPDHPYFNLIDGVLYDKADMRLICYPSTRTDNTYAIPEGILAIGSYAFYECESLANITLPDSLTAIGDLTFGQCKSLVKITLPDSLTAIGNQAFYFCESLRSITLPDSVTAIGDKAFYYCSNLYTIIVGQDSYAREYCIANDLSYTFENLYGL